MSTYMHIAWHQPKMEIFLNLGSVEGQLYLVIIAIPLIIHYHPHYLGNEMKDEMLIGLFKTTELIARVSTHPRSK